jgi:hypothetical protein
MVRSARRAEDEGGAAIVEATIVLVLLLVAAIGAAEYTRLLRYYRAASFVSREAASAASSDCASLSDPRACLRSTAERLRNAGVEMMKQDLEVIVSIYECPEVGGVPCAAPTQAGVCRAYRASGVDGIDGCIRNTTGANPAPYDRSRYSTPTFSTGPLFADLQAQKRFTIAEIRTTYLSTVGNLFSIITQVNGRTIHEATLF